MRVSVLAGCALLVAACPASPTTIHVAPDSTGDVPNIQAAIDAATGGDTIELSDGTFTGDGNRDLNFGTKDLVLRSVNGSDATILDCGGDDTPPGNHLAIVVEGGQTASTRIEGITIRNVHRTRPGGAIYVRNGSPVLRGVRFASCMAAGGPGVCVLVEAGQPVIDACEFTDNGGAQSLVQASRSEIRIQGSTFLANTAQWLLDLGGGSVEDCTFTSNPGACILAEGGHSPHLYVQGCSFNYNAGPCVIIPSDVEAVVGGCQFVHNGGFTVRAGAIQANGTTTVRHCRLLGDRGGQGAEIYFYSAARSLVLDHCIVVQAFDAGSEAIYATCRRLEATHCTFLGSFETPYVGRGNAITIGGNADVSIDHTIIAFGGQEDLPDGAIHCLDSPREFSVSCTDIFGNLGGDWTGCVAASQNTSHNLSADPLFCNAGSWDLSLQANSPCAPSNNGACGLIGALGAWCGPLAVQDRSWGSIKALYR